MKRDFFYTVPELYIEPRRACPRTSRERAYIQRMRMSMDAQTVRAVLAGRARLQREAVEEQQRRQRYAVEEQEQRARWAEQTALQAQERAEEKEEALRLDRIEKYRGGFAVRSVWLNGYLGTPGCYWRRRDQGDW